MNNTQYQETRSFTTGNGFEIRMKSEEKRFLIMKKDSDKKKNNWIN